MARKTKKTDRERLEALIASPRRVNLGYAAVTEAGYEVGQTVPLSFVLEDGRTYEYDVFDLPCGGFALVEVLRDDGGAVCDWVPV